LSLDCILMNNDELMRYWHGLEKEISVTGFGCWQIAGNHDVGGRPNGWGDIDQRQAQELISNALDAGIRFFDTAQGYGRGTSEQILGTVINNHSCGEEAVVCTKISAPLAHDTQAINKEVDQAIDLSLQRLARDCIDIVLLHNPPDDYSYTKGLIEAFEVQRCRGRIKTYGISATTIGGINNAIDAGFGTCVEWNFNILERRPIHDVFPLCRAHNINFIARSPLARGLLSEKFFNSRQSYFAENEFRSTLDQDWVNWVKSEMQRIIDAGLPSEQISQYAIEYILKFDEVSAVIPGIRTLEHLGSLRRLITDNGIADKTFHTISKLLPDYYPGYR
jgi:aryl-alcohol dehydrogenase-like predicted oxidoreductase